MKTTLGLYCVGTTFHDSTESLLRPCSLTSSLRFFEHVQNSPTSTKTIKIAPRPYRFLLRSFYVVQVRTASKRFYIDVVGTWSSVTGVLGTKLQAPVNHHTSSNKTLARTRNDRVNNFEATNKILNGQMINRLLHS